MKTELIDIPIELHPGEKAVLLLAKKLGVREVLIDEKPVRFAAKLLGLRPRGAVFVLLKALKGGMIDLDEFLDTLSEMIRHSFGLRAIEAIKEAKRISSLR